MRVFPRVAALFFAALAGLLVPACEAQATYAGTGPGSYVSIGLAVSGFESGEYGKTKIAGGTLFVDANLYRRIGIEAEARELNLHSDIGIHETNYLVGPKLSLKGRTLRPYGKFLAGRGDFRFPYGYGYGKYFMLAPGAGLDWRVHMSKWIVRLVDFEYQIWPTFLVPGYGPYGAIHPYGVSAGLSYRVY